MPVAILVALIGLISMIFSIFIKRTVDKMDKEDEKISNYIDLIKKQHDYKVDLFSLISLLMGIVLILIFLFCPDIIVFCRIFGIITVVCVFFTANYIFDGSINEWYTIIWGIGGIISLIAFILGLL